MGPWDGEDRSQDQDQDLEPEQEPRGHSMTSVRAYFAMFPNQPLFAYMTRVSS